MLSSSENKPLRYLALGDSYTIGEAVAAAASFPFQLRDHWQRAGLQVQTPVVVARTGWTTDELQAALAAENWPTPFDRVTLLIGVNNQYRGYPLAQYQIEFRALLQSAIGYAAGQAAAVSVLSIPDWGNTPFAQASGRDLSQISVEIDAFNVVNREETLLAGSHYVDITPLSRSNEAGLIASDGLHYSGAMYVRWAALL